LWRATIASQIETGTHHVKLSDAIIIGPVRPGRLWHVDSMRTARR
jgi:hypothetical protein